MQSFTAGTALPPWIDPERAALTAVGSAYILKASAFFSFTLTHLSHDLTETLSLRPGTSA